MSIITDVFNQIKNEILNDVPLEDFQIDKIMGIFTFYKNDIEMAKNDTYIWGYQDGESDCLDRLYNG